MESAFAWLGNIAEWIGNWIPKWEMVKPTHRGVLYVSYWHHTLRPAIWWRGWKAKIKVKVLEPGTHFYWPVRSTLLNHPVNRQTNDLREQTFTTTDGVTMGAAGVITFEINDIVKALVETYNVDTNVVDIALTAVHSVCCRWTKAELKTHEISGELDKLLKAEAQKALNPYGVKVFKLNLTDLAPTRNIKLSNSNFQVA